MRRGKIRGGYVYTIGEWSYFLSEIFENIQHKRITQVEIKAVNEKMHCENSENLLRVLVERKQS